MRITHRFIVEALAIVAFTCITTSIALGDDDNGMKHWTLTVSPVYFLNMLPDANSPAPPGYTPYYDTIGLPRTTDDVRIDYGIAYAFNDKFSISYQHSNFDLSLGRFFIGKEAVISGDINDRTDQATISYALRPNINVNAYWSTTQRINVAGFCLNQERCAPGQLSLYQPIGPGGWNPASMNINLTGIGFTYSLGPVNKYTGPLLTLAGDAQYMFRPTGQGACAAPNIGSRPPFNAPTCNTNGVVGYVGSRWELPYSATLNVPFGGTIGFVPVFGYARDQYLFRGVNTPETYNEIFFGVSRAIVPGLVFSYMNERFNGCYCSDNVPTPNTLRFQLSIFRLTYAYKF